jgi:hypothetical protein
VNVLKHEKKVAVIAALVEGNSIRSVSRMTGVHKTTILRLITDKGAWCERVMDERMRALKCTVNEADKLWGFVGKKQCSLTIAEKNAAELGDAYPFVAFDPISMLVPVIEIGKRGWATTHLFIRQLRVRVTGRIQLSTGAFTTYTDAVEQAFGANVDYAQVVKQSAPEDAGRGRYSPPAVIGVERPTIQGQPRRERISASYVERNNLIFRMSMRRFTRLTNGFSKKLANLKAMVWLLVADYNFCRLHGSIRVTPAMAAGVTDHVWELAELVA